MGSFVELLDGFVEYGIYEYGIYEYLYIMPLEY